MASFDVDIFPILDFTEDVTLRKVNQLTGTTTDYASVTGWCINQVEPVITPDGVQMVVERMSWHLRASDLATDIRPDRGDRVIAASDSVYAGTYVLESAALVARGTRWVCEVATKLVAP